MTERKRRSDPVRARLKTLIVTILTGVAMAFPTPQTAAQQPPKKFVLHATPKPLPSVPFWNSDGKTLQITDFRGRVILLNIWAT